MIPETEGNRPGDSRQAQVNVYGGGNITVTFCNITSQIWQPGYGKCRSASIRDAHNIVVMSQGSIVEQGTHDELLERRGAY